MFYFPIKGTKIKKNQIGWGFWAGNVKAGKSLRAILMLSMTGCATKKPVAGQWPQEPDELPERHNN
jgi:hypothetical protein